MSNFREITPQRLQNGSSKKFQTFKGELQRENKFISYERAVKMLENDMCITGMHQAVLKSG